MIELRITPFLGMGRAFGERRPAHTRDTDELT